MWDNGLFLQRLGTLFFAFAFLLALYAGWRLVTSMSAFNFQQIEITGTVDHMTPSMAKAAVKTSLTGNFFGQRLEAVQAAFEKLPWVQEATVRRIWPDKLIVEIQEYQAFARWGDTALIDQKGAIFQGATDELLPVLIGPQDTQHDVMRRYESFSEALASTRSKIAKLELTNRYAWVLTLTTGEVIQLGKEDKAGVIQDRVTRFASVYPQLKHLYGNALAKVDMRYANGFVVTKSEADQQKLTSVYVVEQPDNAA